MAVTNLESLVLRGVLVGNDEGTGRMLIGSNPATDQAPATLSFARGPSLSRPRTGYQPGKRRVDVDADMDAAAKRAGRSGRVGTLAGRKPAITVMRNVPSRTVPTAGHLTLPAAAFRLCKAKAPLQAGEVHRWPATRCCCRAERSQRQGLQPAGEASTAMSRGTRES